jgi:hypothetical protein
VGSRAGLDAVERRKTLPLPGLEVRQSSTTETTGVTVRFHTRDGSAMLCRIYTYGGSVYTTKIYNYMLYIGIRKVLGSDLR